MIRCSIMFLYYFIVKHKWIQIGLFLFVIVQNGSLTNWRFFAAQSHVAQRKRNDETGNCILIWIQNINIRLIVPRIVQEIRINWPQWRFILARKTVYKETRYYCTYKVILWDFYGLFLYYSFSLNTGCPDRCVTW